MKLVEVYRHSRKGDQRIDFERAGKMVDGKKKKSGRTGRPGSCGLKMGNEWDLLGFREHEGNLRAMRSFLAPIIQPIFFLPWRMSDTLTSKEEASFWPCVFLSGTVSFLSTWTITPCVSITINYSLLN